MGQADELSSVPKGSFFGDVFDVDSNRALTTLEANVVLAAGRDLRWCVFELVGSYYVSRYEKIVKGQTGSGYLSSGALSNTLKAGKRYLLGVAVAGGGAAPYYDSVPWQPEVSFRQSRRWPDRDLLRFHVWLRDERPPVRLESYDRATLRRAA